MDSKNKSFTTDDLKQEMQKPLLRLCHLLSPPDVRTHSRILNHGEVEYSLKWVGLMGPDNKGVNEHEAKLCLLQLGLLSGLGKIDEIRAKIVSDYIWARYPDPSNYAELVHWLKINHPRRAQSSTLSTESVVSERTNGLNQKSSAIIKKQIQKKRKQQRQAKKSSRRK